MIVLLTVFFTSKMWLYDDNPIRQTQFNKEIDTLQQTNLALLEWKYNEEKNFMEVVLDKEFVGTDSIIPTYDFEAREIELNHSMRVDVVYEDKHLLVLHLKDIPEKYKFINLTVIEIRDKEVVRAELEDQLIEDEELQELTDEDFIDSNEVILTGDYRKIELDDNLSVKSGEEYKADSVRNEINLTKKQIENIKEKKIPLEDRFIVEEEKKIASLEKELDYQSGDEKEETKQVIENYKGNIKSSIAKKEEYKANLKELENKLKGLEEKLEHIVNGKEEPSETDDSDDGNEDENEDNEMLDENNKDSNKKQKNNKKSDSTKDKTKTKEKNKKKDLENNRGKNG